MKKFILSLLLVPIVIVAQVDTLDWLSYFPLHVGDKWVYEIATIKNSEWDTSYQTISVIGDTTMSNNYTYFKMGSEGPYYRIDTTTLCVKTFIKLTDTLLYDLSPFEAEIDSTILADGSIMCREKVQGNAGKIAGQFDKIAYYLISDATVLDYLELTKGIGYTKYVIEEAMPYQKLLVGAEIDGVVYGNISEIVPDISQPDNFRLHPNYPNPFNPSTTVVFQITKPISEKAVIKIYNTRGELVRTISKHINGTGYYKISWDGKSESGVLLPAGNYFYSINYGNSIQNGKMCLIK